MPTPLSTSSAVITVSRAAESGPNLAVECFVRSVIEPHAGSPSWPRQVARALREGLPDFDIPAARVTVSERDPSTVRIVWTPLPEQAIWPVVQRLGEELEFRVLALARITIEVDYR